ncbi:hypothetical protein WMF38_14745 [Sorangium sp. So ce118]
MIRSSILAALLSLATFLGVTLTTYVNDPRSGDIFTSSGLPLLINELLFLSSASLGASFANLFQIDREVSSGRFVPRHESSYWVRFVLGIMAGLLLATVLNISQVAPKDAGQLERIHFSAAGLALMGGFSSSVVQRILQRMIETLEALVRGSGEAEVAARELANKMKLEQSLAAERVRVTLLLSDVQRRLAAGEDADSILHRLDQVNRRVMSSDGQETPPTALPPAEPPLELRAVVESDNGAPLAWALYEVVRDGRVVTAGRADGSGGIAQAVKERGSYEVVILDAGAAASDGQELPDLRVRAEADPNGYVEPEQRAHAEPGPRTQTEPRLDAHADLTPDDDMVSRHQRAVWHAARREIARGVRQHGERQSWETTGSNTGPIVDDYLWAFQMPPSPWCGMFVGYNCLQAGFSTEGQLPAELTTDGRPVARKTMFQSAVRLMLYLQGAGCPHVEFPKKGSGPRTRSECAAWLAKHLGGFRPRPGDILLCRTSLGEFKHVAMVASYDAATYELVTYEGNYHNRAGAWRWELSEPNDAGFYRINMIGRLKPEDFEERFDGPADGPSPDPIVERGVSASAV